MERVGTAGNSGRLVMDEGRVLDLDWIAALGYAGIEMLKPDEDDPKRWQGPELLRFTAALATLLWRAKAGRDQVARRHCVAFLAELASDWPEFQPVDDLRVRWILRPFMSQVLDEWIDDTCPGCRGTGLQERVGRRGRQAPSIFGNGLQRSICAACHGAKRARQDDKSRARGMCIPRAWFTELAWPQRFAKARKMVAEISQRAYNPLRSANSTDILRA